MPAWLDRVLPRITIEPPVEGGRELGEEAPGSASPAPSGG